MAKRGPYDGHVWYSGVGTLIVSVFVIPSSMWFNPGGIARVWYPTSSLCFTLIAFNVWVGVSHRNRGSALARIALVLLTVADVLLLSLLILVRISDPFARVSRLPAPPTTRLVHQYAAQRHSPSGIVKSRRAAASSDRARQGSSG